MSIPLKEKVVKELEGYLKTDLYQVPRRLILFNGILNDGSTVTVCTPQSKLIPRGCGRIELTTFQVSILNNADHSILAFRLEDNRVYYLDFCNLKPYLTEEAAYYSEKRGITLWQLYIWSHCIQILRSKNRLAISPNRLTELGDHYLAL
ncbi:hypothetical protein [Desulfosporosinus meridiei]|uniref:Uncharacterized protein n=1 Tax=Desulfosporosinus meridiei (strain ATCC BAA-275 / DSM 13257 / KCTC 12902 / NCIMB 13706 / S10) TaxID=768704 RepID=J7ILA1_DESMD|nr:hypothetical protein [Desulfosporosinus meridiei]AFQ42577.1 hypothetical protein Desmer_0535 [Desulfosporosinus meridiei DSM 13257]